MSKEKQASKNYADYSYIGEETITMTVPEFIAIQKALDQAISNGVIAQHPQVIRWYDVATQKPVENPTEKQITGQKVRQLADAEATKSEYNLRVSYNANLFPVVFNGREVTMAVHERMVEDGVAKPIDVVKQAYEERKAKGQMQVQEEELQPEVVKTSQREGKMKVVKDSNKE